jgi:hypothetical protein
MKDHLVVRSLCSLVLIFSLQTFGQSIKYTSDVDQGLVLKTLAVAPLVDNVSGIYAKPLDETLKNSVSANHQWEVKELDASIKSTPEELESNSNAVKAALKKSSADGLVSGRISKGPNGVSMKVTLYAGAEGLPVGFEVLENYSGFNVNDLKMQLQSVMKHLLAKLPYHAHILSRKGQLVTLNIGSSSGIRPGMEATAIQIIKLRRHPKFGFIISTDTLTLGKVQINKVDEYLSFGTVTTERDVNAVSIGTKVNFGNFVDYPNTNVTSDGKIVGDLNAHGDNSLAFGDKPKEWAPQPPPSFGKVGIMLGLGNYSISNSLNSGGITGTASVVPSIHLNGELWLNPNWSLNVTISDYVTSVSNGLAGSTPSILNASTSREALSANYSFLMTDDFFGPKISAGLGYSIMSTYIDNSSPTAYESTSYSGLFLRLGGSLPIVGAENARPFCVGGHLDYFIHPGVTEAPTTSGSSSSQVTSFAVSGEKMMSDRINLRGEIMFDSMISNFSGTGSRTVPSSSGSQTFTTFALGAGYLF